MRQLWAAAVVVSIGCASAPIKKVDLAALAGADARLLEGCYDCLIDARTTYARVAVGKARPLVLPQLFEAELLLLLREKELTLDWAGSLSRVREIAGELPATIDAAHVLAIVDAVPTGEVGTPFREADQFRQERRTFAARVEDELTWLGTAALRLPVRQYLSLAVECAYPRPRQPGRPPPSSPVLPVDAPPLVEYRHATCRSFNVLQLDKVRAAVPRFVETSFFVARPFVATAKDNGGARARDLLAEAYKRFPQSPSVTYLTGNLHQVVGDCRTALRFYDETLAIKSLHENGLLGRTMCLSLSKQTDEAIATATRMIELQTYNVADAYYWRAWNHHLRTALDLARGDIESAKRRSSDMNILTLAGIIEYDQADLTPAERDLTRARSGADGANNCTAMWYLGLVGMKRTQWAASATHFEDAMACYERAVLYAEASLEKMRARTDLEPEFRDRQIANLDTSIKTDRGQYHASAFNAANQHAAGSNIARAKELVEIAAKDPALADLVAKLREFLKRIQDLFDA